MQRILTSYYRPKPGGFCKRLFRGINALLQAGCEVHYLAVIPFPIEHPNCHFHRFPWPARYTDGLLFWALFHLISPFTLTFLAFRHRISHMFAFSPSYGLLLQPARFLKRIPLSIFVRADTIENHKLKERPFWLIQLELFLEAIAIHGTYLYGVSDELTNSISARHPYSSIVKASTLRNDINPGYQMQSHFSNALQRLAVVGILEARKNQRIVIEAMPRLISTGLCLDIYGEGRDAEQLHDLVNLLNLNEYIHFKGWVPENEIWPHVDLLLMPSLHEGAPNAVLEALERGIPVLASDIAEHREILPPESLISLSDAGLWADRILYISSSPSSELSRLRNLEMEYAKQLDFDWNEHFIQAVTSINSQ